MKAPAISVDVHHHLTPDLRQRIIDDVRARMQEPSYRLLSPEHLRELAQLDTGGPALTSLYLQLTPERRTGRAWQTALSALAHTALQLADNAMQKMVRADIGEIERALNDQLPALGRGAAFFVCRERGIWRQIALPIALPDQIRIGTRPYLRPMLRSWGSHDRTLIALLSREQSRFFATHLGTLEEIYRVKGQRIRGMLTDRVPLDRRDAVAASIIKDEAKALAAMAELINREFEASNILLSGSPEMSAAFRGYLSKHLVDRITPFEASIHASPVEIAAAAAPVQQQLRLRAEREVLEALREAVPGAASTGTQETLDCLGAGRVLKLVADDSYVARGIQCRQCQRLFELAQMHTCPCCGSTLLEPVDDLVEAALQQALDRRASVAFIREPDYRVAFAARAPLQALLRY
ncbi:baeRF10 domain-containing protein [Bradyrhizobium canariense]|uniref:baeRF10 domain-containing protein n=1 Tax=Bradyrhizobium canariense TaxID=255045 RepID=UPI000A193CDF|nr:hypothetical protein [Bradyrhizobium canariense]OSI23687.1 hypothetical protein BST65_20415 [Bradyrhizobium canariense]OSI31057.1 hypothetical protein BST66_21430 [Bradyrhizobium canariense]OSI39961.1 hypothetical protein BSZ20_28980 [Bradyrhizobium canariense]OSI48252.1 hypothetical protein BST67_19460 [Bradyrhizobium canariense]OSI50137.1 hypothetical protein BSZ15_34315 [Bradyrhizobium canariense]